MVSPVYVYIDKRVIEVHMEGAYHEGDASYYVELTDPVLSLNLDGTNEQWRESFARLGEWLAKRREGQS